MPYKTWKTADDRIQTCLLLQEYLYHDPTMSKGKIRFLSYTKQKENKNIFHIIFMKYFMVYIFVLFIICFDQKHIVNTQENL